MLICHESPYIVEVDNVLTSEECEKLIEKIEALRPSVAPINTALGARVHTDVRNNERVMYDDQELAAYLVDQVRDRMPELIGNRVLVGANERIRCYRYKPGMRFAPHADGSFRRDDQELSVYSFLVYLNEGFVGGETRFFTEPEITITPKTGKALLFQHPIIHEGALVTDGTKYVARTDLMYRLQTPAD